MALKAISSTGVVAMIFISIFSYVTENNALKYNCFTETNETKCERSRFKICGDFYACDLVVKLSSPPKRIVYRDGKILLSSGGSTYIVNTTSQVAQQVNMLIPPTVEQFDNKGNAYFSAEGTSYVVQKDTGKETEIVTTEAYSYNQHAIDAKANKLFILSFDSNNEDANDKIGQIYAVNTDPLNVVDGKVHAELVEGAGNHVTALAVQGGLDYLLLGVNEENKSKLIRLKRQKFDPCSPKESKKLSIQHIIKEMEKKVLKIVDNAISEPASMTKALRAPLESNIQNLLKENQRLKHSLNITTEKLYIFTQKLSGFYTSNYKKPNVENNKIPRKGFATTTSRGPISHSNSNNGKICYSKHEVDSLNAEVKALKEHDSNSHKQLGSLFGDLNAIINITSSEYTSD